MYTVFVNKSGTRLRTGAQSCERLTMRNINSKPNPTPRVPLAVQAILWVTAIGAPSYVLYNNGVRDARRDAEQHVLSQVAATIQSMSTDRGDVLALLAQHEHEVSKARYFRTCSRLGMKTDWKEDWGTLFDDVSRRSKEDQTKAARVIAEECGLDPDSTLKRERMCLMLKRVAATADVLFTSMQAGPVTDGS